MGGNRGRFCFGYAPSCDSGFGVSAWDYQRTISWSGKKLAGNQEETIVADLELQHISKSFGHTRVLNNVSLEADTGEFVVLLGPSGCGKSTLLRIIAGLEPQTEGSVLIGSTTVDGLSPRDRDIAMIFQHYALYPHLTVRENLAFGLKLRKEPVNLINSRIQEAADLLEIQP